MITYENQCVGCTSLGLPCMGSGCPNANVPVPVCDWCKDEVEELYEYEGDEVCPDCILNSLTKVKC